MACYHPLPAWRRGDGSIVFVERGDCDRALFLPCGQCVGCRLERSRQWAVRCVHESKTHDFNCFVTLSYNADCVPSFNSLRYSDYQKFMKRVRRRFMPVRVRFYMCGHYGEQFGRPHFHACLFGLDFLDKVYFCMAPSGAKMYRSKVLEELWPFGFSSIGEVTMESAAYVARYCVNAEDKKYWPRGMRAFDAIDLETGELATKVAEFNHMSLKPGIGAKWLDRFWSDVYPHGKVVSRGREVKAPRYYDKIFEKLDGEGYDALEYGRYLESLAHRSDGSWERLAVRETVAKARLESLKRKL